MQVHDDGDQPAISELLNSWTWRVLRARHLPRTADDQSVSSIKVGDAALSSDIGLIVIHQLPQNRDSESTRESRTETIARIISGFGKGVGRQELNTMTHVFFQSGLHTVVD